MIVHQDVSYQSDNRTETYTTRATCQFLQERKQDIDMHREERIEVGKRLLCKHLIIDATLLHSQMGIILQDAFVLIEELNQEFLALLRLAQQTLGDNFLDVVSLNIHLDRETVIQTE